MALLKKLVIIHGPFEIIGMSEFLSNQLFWGLMSDGDYGLPVPADMMYGEVIPHTETFSECISRATNFFNNRMPQHNDAGAYFCRSIQTISGGYSASRTSGSS